MQASTPSCLSAFFHFKARYTQDLTRLAAKPSFPRFLALINYFPLKRRCLWSGVVPVCAFPALFHGMTVAVPRTALLEKT